MNTKKLLIVGAFIAIVILVIKTSSSSKLHTSDASDTTTTGSNGTNPNTGKPYTTSSGPVDGDDLNSDGNGTVVDQSKPTLTQSQMADIANRWHKYFDWTFHEDEFDQLLEDCKEYVFTRADIWGIINKDSYVYDRIFSWIVNDINPNRLTRFNQVLHSNGVDYTFRKKQNKA